MTMFREYITSSGLRVLGGKNSENNDELVNRAMPKDILLHTSAPGSPFCILGASPTKQDIKEAAIFCAKYSQNWRNTKQDVVVNMFKRSSMNKEITMKSGTWSVKNQEKIKVKAGDILKFEKELRSEDITKGD